jgi:hypothetical protein
MSGSGATGVGGAERLVQGEKVVIMSSCHHVIMSSCHHVIMSSCHHVIMSSCHHVIMSTCHQLLFIRLAKPLVIGCVDKNFTFQTFAENHVTLEKIEFSDCF